MDAYTLPRYLCASFFSVYPVFIVGCDSPSDSHTPTISDGTLANLSYPIDVVSTGFVTLEQGVYAEPAAPDSASMTRIELSPWTATGDLDDNGTNDVAVVLTVETGGTGTFFYLAVIVNEKGVPVAKATQYIGDRVIIETLSIDSGEITVGLKERAAGAPMTQNPDVKRIRIFRIMENQVVELEGVKNVL